MESGDTDEGEVVKNVERLRGDYHKPTAEMISVSSFATVNKGVARGTEAADFVAWHWNKYYMDKIRFGKEHQPRKDFEAFVAAAKDKMECIPAIGANLEFFFSLVPAETLSPHD